jgi:hypothetical protein
VSSASQPIIHIPIAQIPCWLKPLTTICELPT